MKRWKLIWKLLTSKYYLLVTWNDAEDCVFLKGEYKKIHKEQNEIVNDMVELMWKHIYNSKEENE